jgi:hypothetical protein
MVACYEAFISKFEFEEYLVEYESNIAVKLLPEYSQYQIYVNEIGAYHAIASMMTGEGVILEEDDTNRLAQLADSLVPSRKTKNLGNVLKVFAEARRTSRYREDIYGSVDFDFSKNGELKQAMELAETTVAFLKADDAIRNGNNCDSHTKSVLTSLNLNTIIDRSITVMPLTGGLFREIVFCKFVGLLFPIAQEVNNSEINKTQKRVAECIMPQVINALFDIRIDIRPLKEGTISPAHAAFIAKYYNYLCDFIIKYETLDRCKELLAERQQSSKISNFRTLHMLRSLQISPFVVDPMVLTKLIMYIHDMASNFNDDQFTLVYNIEHPQVISCLYRTIIEDIDTRIKSFAKEVFVEYTDRIINSQNPTKISKFLNLMLTQYALLMPLNTNLLRVYQQMPINDSIFDPTKFLTSKDGEMGETSEGAQSNQEVTQTLDSKPSSSQTRGRGKKSRKNARKQVFK